MMVLGMAEGHTIYGMLSWSRHQDSKLTEKLEGSKKK